LDFSADMEILAAREQSRQLSPRKRLSRRS